MEYLGRRPLCMNQYYQLLSSCRVPGIRRDTVVNHAKGSMPPTHITVVHNLQVGPVGDLPGYSILSGTTIGFHDLRG